jgi:hypothetical protein
MSCQHDEGNLQSDSLDHRPKGMGPKGERQPDAAGHMQHTNSPAILRLQPSRSLACWEPTRAWAASNYAAAHASTWPDVRSMQGDAHAKHAAQQAPQRVARTTGCGQTPAACSSGWRRTQAPPVQRRGGRAAPLPAGPAPPLLVSRCSPDGPPPLAAAASTPSVPPVLRGTAGGNPGSPRH